jgi:hypothetical protein
VAAYIVPRSASPSSAPDAPFRTTGDEVELTSLSGENQRRPSPPIVDGHDFDARKYAAWRERQLVSATNWRNRPQAARQVSPKLPDAQPGFFAFRIYKADGMDASLRRDAWE